MGSRVTAIVPAAGLGLRMGGSVRKQFRFLGGVPLVVHSLRLFQTSSVIDSVVLVVPRADIEYCRTDIIQTHGFAKVTAIAAGGQERQDSVRNGLTAMPRDTEVVVVHDAVRPFVTERMVTEVVDAARDKGAAIIALPMRDTVKQVGADGVIERTVDRRPLWLAQTPQAFRAAWLKEAHDKALAEGIAATDDAFLIEWLGRPVSVIEGSGENIKVTRPEDMVIGEAIFASRQVSAEKG